MTLQVTRPTRGRTSKAERGQLFVVLAPDILADALFDKFEPTKVETERGEPRRPVTLQTGEKAFKEVVLLLLRQPRPLAECAAQLAREEHKVVLCLADRPRHLFVLVGCRCFAVPTRMLPFVATVLGIECLKKLWKHE
jgi:hypothetical protein